MRGQVIYVYRKILWFALAAVLVFSVAACGKKQSSGANAEDTPGQDNSGAGASAGTVSDGNESDNEAEIDFPFDDTDLRPGNPYDWLDEDAGDEDDQDPVFDSSDWTDEDYEMHGVERPDASVAVNDLIRFGKYNWVVLDVKDGTALVLCESSIDFMPYIYGEIHPTVWAVSAARKWLNEGFIKDSFMAEEKDRIIESNVVTKENPWFKIAGCDDTKDKVFLLSIEEVVQYFGDSGALGNREDVDSWAISDIYNDARMTTYLDTEMSTWWWLRSPGMNDIYASCIDKDGSINVGGEYAGGGGGGVRPAMWIVLQAG